MYNLQKKNIKCKLNLHNIPTRTGIMTYTIITLYTCIVVARASIFSSSIRNNTIKNNNRNNKNNKFKKSKSNYDLMQHKTTLKCI